jgi:hypothetical protein
MNWEEVCNEYEIMLGWSISEDYVKPPESPDKSQYNVEKWQFLTISDFESSCPRSHFWSNLSYNNIPRVKCDCSAPMEDVEGPTNDGNNKFLKVVDTWWDVEPIMGSLSERKEYPRYSDMYLQFRLSLLLELEGSITTINFILPGCHVNFNVFDEFLNRSLPYVAIEGIPDETKKSIYNKYGYWGEFRIMSVSLPPKIYEELIVNNRYSTKLSIGYMETGTANTTILTRMMAVNGIRSVKCILPNICNTPCCNVSVHLPIGWRLAETPKYVKRIYSQLKKYLNEYVVKCGGGMIPKYLLRHIMNFLVDVILGCRMNFQDI